jgi:hypothetical protein
MPKLVSCLPKYRKHKASGQAVVTLNGQDHYLGRWKSAASKAEYNRLIGEYLAHGRVIQDTSEETTVSEVILGIGATTGKFTLVPKRRPCCARGSEPTCRLTCAARAKGWNGSAPNGNATARRRYRAATVRELTGAKSRKNNPEKSIRWKPIP